MIPESIRPYISLLLAKLGKNREAFSLKILRIKSLLNFTDCVVLRNQLELDMIK